MPSYRTEHSRLTFNTGEITSLLAGRTDIEKVSNACRTLTNMVARPSGVAEKRVGFTVIAYAAGNRTPHTWIWDLRQ